MQSEKIGGANPGALLSLKQKQNNMSRMTSLGFKLKQIFTGVHLVIIADIFLVKGDDNVVLQKDGGIRVRVRFTSGEGQSFDKDYWTLESDFLQMLTSFKVKPLSDKYKEFKEGAIGCRGWICIKQVLTGSSEGAISETNYYIFDTKPFSDSGKKPVIVGDPADNNGHAHGVFEEDKREGKSLVERLIPLDNELNIAFIQGNTERVEEIQQMMEEAFKVEEDIPDNGSRSQRAPKVEVKAEAKPQAPKIGEIDWSQL